MAWRDTITVTDVLDYLNEALRTDPDALSRLVSLRVPCNKAMLDHPVIQVRLDANGQPSISPLALLNGLFGGHRRWGLIAALLDDEGRIGKFLEVTPEMIERWEALHE